jgi:hypothetical protein
MITHAALPSPPSGLRCSTAGDPCMGHLCLLVANLLQLSGAAINTAIFAAITAAAAVSCCDHCCWHCCCCLARSCHCCWLEQLSQPGMCNPPWWVCNGAMKGAHTGKPVQQSSNEASGLERSGAAEEHMLCATACCCLWSIGSRTVLLVLSTCTENPWI